MCQGTCRGTPLQGPLMTFVMFWLTRFMFRVQLDCYTWWAAVWTALFNYFGWVQSRTGKGSHTTVRHDQSLGQNEWLVVSSTKICCNVCCLQSNTECTFQRQITWEVVKTKLQHPKLVVLCCRKLSLSTPGLFTNTRNSSHSALRWSTI